VYEIREIIADNLHDGAWVGYQWCWEKLIMEIPQKLKEYIDNNRGSLPPITDPDEPLQIDSLGLIRLVAFLEKELGYLVENDELIPENFATLRQLSQLLSTKTPTGPTGEAKLSPDLSFGTQARRQELQ
jgi:acyl carrier protein